MTLVAAKLESALLDFFKDPSGFNASADAEVMWTKAYDAYAKDAVDASQDKVVKTNKQGFQSQLQFDSVTSTPQIAAKNFDNAFVAYWTGGLFKVGKPPTPAAPCPSLGGNTIFGVEIASAVSVVAPSVLEKLLLPIFLGVNTGTRHHSQAQAIAQAFHLATTSAVTVLITGLDTTPPPAGPLPVSNRCGLF